MRSLYILLTILVVAWLGSATPIDPKRWLVNRPVFDQLRSRRSPQVKGEPPIKGLGRVPLTRTPPALRKGEYMCGNRVCSLKPGEVPKGCNGICQYPVKK